VHGIGLRTTHFAQLLEHGLQVGLVEAISENFAGRGGRPLAVLERVRKDSLVALHGVSLSIGGLDPLRREWLLSLKTLAARIEAAWVSDHLCFSTFGGHSGHDLWPLPHTEEALDHVVARVCQVQDVLGRRLVLENVSSYVRYHVDALPEWQFLSEVAERADCELLLDVNNVFVNARNHGFDARHFIKALPTRRLRQLHLAGHTDKGTHLFDSHSGAVAESVWELYCHCVEVHGAIPTIIEWDDEVPPLPRLLAESRRAEALEAQVLARRAPQ
jgi:uncharacterized protein